MAVRGYPALHNAVVIVLSSAFSCFLADVSRVVGLGMYDGLPSLKARVGVREDRAVALPCLQKPAPLLCVKCLLLFTRPRYTGALSRPPLVLQNQNQCSLGLRLVNSHQGCMLDCIGILGAAVLLNTRTLFVL